MKALLDACVLYPTVLREILVGVAQAGLFTPLWSERILEEWARATTKLGPAAELVARAEISALRAQFPDAAVQKNEGLEARLWLPDVADIHVLASAIAGNADLIVTFNAADFPRGILAEEGLRREDPDTFILGLWREAPVAVERVIEAVRQEAERLSNESQPLRPLLKRAKLPRVGKALAG